MGRTLDLSQLTDAEAQHVWGVVQRDLALRRKEEERLRGLRGEIQRESAQREAAPPHLSHCACCLQPYLPQDPPQRQCPDCGLASCPRCSQAHPEEQDWLCHPCHLARVVQFGSLEWYYGHLRTRFKRFGSAKVIRSLSGRLRGTGHVSEAELSAKDVSGDSEQTDEEPDTHVGTTVQPLGSKTKRRLSVHGGDLLDSQDAVLSPTDSLEALTDKPGSKGILVTEDADTSNWGCHAGPGIDDPGQQQAPPEGSANLATGDGDSVRDHREAHDPSQRSGPPASESQTPQPTDADMEEAALRRKLEELVTHLSEDEEEGHVGHSGTLGAAPEVPRVELHPQSPGTPAEDSRTTAEELTELEDKVATAASEVQQAESEVTDIRSRIAALQAAGLTVRPSGTPQRKSNLPVLLPRLARRPGRSPGVSHTDSPREDQVVAEPHPLGATLKGSPKALGSSFQRESLYRSSLTQRNPTRRSANARLGFAKPVMTHQP